MGLRDDELAEVRRQNALDIAIVAAAGGFLPPDHLVANAAVIEAYLRNGAPAQPNARSSEAVQ